MGDKNMVCILVTGIPASGKSFFSRYLADYLNIPCISKDNIKERLFDTVGFKSRAEKVGLNEAATEEMLYFAEALMKHKDCFILECNFEKESKRQVSGLIAKYKYRCITVFMSGDHKAIYERFVRRNEFGDRHPRHIVNDYYPREVQKSDFDAISFESFEREIKTRGMDDFEIGDSYFRVDTTNIEKVDWEAKAAEIKDAMAGYLSNGKGKS